jgi:hypothetical protein
MESIDRTSGEKCQLTFFDFLVDGCVTFFSSTFLNVLIGLFGGLAINVYSSDPNNELFDTSIYLLFLSIFISVLLLFINERLASLRPEKRSIRPVLATRYSFENLATVYSKSLKFLRAVYVLIVMLYVTCLFMGIREFTAGSYQMKVAESKSISEQQHVIKDIAFLKKALERQEYIIKNLRDTINVLRSSQTDVLSNKRRSLSLPQR